MISEKIWECPTCFSGFDKEKARVLMAAFQNYLSTRPSPTMDCRYEKAVEMQGIYNKLRNILWEQDPKYHSDINNYKLRAKKEYENSIKEMEQWEKDNAVS